MKLPRPYTPLSVCLQVVDRQLAERGLQVAGGIGSLSDNLKFALNVLFGHGVKVELHHRPALLNRISKNGRYYPDANDPDYLVYLPVDEHDIETRVRGQHGQHSDLALARKRKRKERKAKRPKRKWPSRPFPKRSKRRALEGK